MCLTLSMVCVCAIGIIVQLLALIQLQYVNLNWKDRLRHGLNGNEACDPFEYFPVYNFVGYTMWPSSQHNQFSFEYFTYDGCGLVQPLRISTHPLGTSGHLPKLKLIAFFSLDFFHAFLLLFTFMPTIENDREREGEKKGLKTGKKWKFSLTVKKKAHEVSLAEYGIDGLNRVTMERVYLSELHKSRASK